MQSDRDEFCNPVDCIFFIVLSRYHLRNIRMCLCVSITFSMTSITYRWYVDWSKVIDVYPNSAGLVHIDDLKKYLFTLSVVQFILIILNYSYDNGLLMINLEQ